ncbi:hypothetical protein [Iningainema tapete]|uniref:hypothetical protein n=1 Tax=Iningainema tapete TaxID=2806730 RepID=UPI0030DCCA9D
MHGKFTFELQRYKYQGLDVNYFELTNQFPSGYISNRLLEFTAYYSNRLSYTEVENLIIRTTGDKLLSDQTCRQIVINKATDISEQLVRGVESTLSASVEQPLIVNQNVEIYEPDSPSILLFDDAIQVKAQKSKREKSTIKLDKTDGQELNKTSTPAVNTDVVILQTSRGEFEYITASLPRDEDQESMSLALVVKAKIIQEYGQQNTPLNLVAITDGAKVIRQRLLSLFSQPITIILDWYHLGKKLRELMSMIARNKQEKSEHLKFLFSRLWRGQTTQAIEYLSNQVVAKNKKKLLELIGYLEKHQSEIINYERRAAAGTTIGSGRVEKGVDLVVGHRQKKKGMSWRTVGSKALAILKVVELNGQWQHIWGLESVIA